MVIRSDRPSIPTNKAAFYEKFLQPVVQTYREFGVAADYKPVNDIIANGRKVSGNGAAEIEGMMVLVGNFIMDFNYEMMSKILRVPDEKFRDKVFKTLNENLSTMLRETGTFPDTSALAAALINNYEPLLGSLPLKTMIDDELRKKADELIHIMHTPDWTFNNDRLRLDNRQVKIREGVYVIQNMLKTPGGLVRVTAVNEEGFLRNVHISGDFFFYPADYLPDLEIALNNVEAASDSITKAVEDFYSSRTIESPGLQPADFARALVSNYV